jgi:hypothetical protein
VVFGGLWLPGYVEYLVPQPNILSRSILPYAISGNLRDFVIPGGDAEIANGADVQFVMRLGTLFCVRSLNANDPRQVAPWGFGIREVVAQKAGVTLINNVIDPDLGENAILTVEQTLAGMATVQVFTLDGNLVRVLHRGRLVTGTHTFTWDGRNGAGEVVARGVYFIRVVAPGIDEIRKVMVVR